MAEQALAQYKEECSFAKIKCDYCNTAFLGNENHSQNCPNAPSSCDICQEKLKNRYVMEKHRSLAHFTGPAPCYYSAYGCNNKLESQQEFDEHHSTFQQNHLELVTIKLAEIGQDIRGDNHRNEALHNNETTGNVEDKYKKKYLQLEMFLGVINTAVEELKIKMDQGGIVVRRGDNSFLMMNVELIKKRLETLERRLPCSNDTKRDCLAIKPEYKKSVGGRDAHPHMNTASNSSAERLQTTNRPAERPKFVDQTVQQRFGCGLCGKVLMDPVQTSCATRVCRECILSKFTGTSEVIRPCPLRHDDEETMEIDDLECGDGLKKKDLHADPATRRHLYKEMVYCPNREYGCAEQMKWRRLEDHTQGCKFKPGTTANVEDKYKKKHRQLQMFLGVINTAIEGFKLKMDRAGSVVQRGSDSLLTMNLEPIKKRLDMMERRLPSSYDSETLSRRAREISQLKLRVIELDGRLVSSSAGMPAGTGFSGILTWKISDYARKKQDALAGRNVSLYSQPFYSGETGYKMCGRIYLNGDGLGKGKCLSLFFVVMKGDFDELLEWPFVWKVTFSILCPGNPLLDYSETFMPDKDSSSFRKPITDMNVASGCAEFKLQSEVESKYVKSDTLYIRIKVHDPCSRD